MWAGWRIQQANYRAGAVAWGEFRRNFSAGSVFFRQMNISHEMKTLIAILIIGAALVAALYASGYQPDAADFGSIFFAAGLGGWVIQDYSRHKPLLSPPLGIPQPLSADRSSSPPAGPAVA